MKKTPQGHAVVAAVNMFLETKASKPCCEELPYFPCDLPSLDVPMSSDVSSYKEYRSLKELKKNWDEIQWIRTFNHPNGSIQIQYARKYVGTPIEFKTDNISLLLEGQHDLVEGLRQLFGIARCKSFSQILKEKRINLSIVKEGIPMGLFLDKTKCSLDDRNRQRVIRHLSLSVTTDNGGFATPSIQIPGTRAILAKEGSDFVLALSCENSFDPKSSKPYSVPNGMAEQIDKMEEFLKGLPAKRSNGDSPVVCHLDGSVYNVDNMKAKNYWNQNGKLGFDWEEDEMDGEGFLQGPLIYRELKEGEGKRREIYECKNSVTDRKKQDLYQNILSVCEEGTRLWTKEGSAEQRIKKEDFGVAGRVEKGKDFSTVQYEKGDIFVAENLCFGRLKSEPSNIYLMDELNAEDALKEGAKASETPKQPSKDAKALDSKTGKSTGDSPTQGVAKSPEPSNQPEIYQVLSINKPSNSANISKKSGDVKLQPSPQVKESNQKEGSKMETSRQNRYKRRLPKTYLQGRSVQDKSVEVKYNLLSLSAIGVLAVASLYLLFPGDKNPKSQRKSFL